MGKARNSAKYHLIKNRKVVHRGITGRLLEDREYEHQKNILGVILSR